jgi:ribose transport system substrate-binding protein
VAVAKQKGWSVSQIDPNGSESAAIAGMQDFVQKKVDVIITAVFPSSGLLAGALAAKNAGIPVVSLSGGTGTGVQTQWDAGTLSGKLIVAKMIHDSGGKGALLAYEYNDGLPCVERQAQLNLALKAAHFSSVTTEQVPIPGQVAAGTSFASAWLAKHPSERGAAHDLGMLRRPGRRCDLGDSVRWSEGDLHLRDRRVGSRTRGRPARHHDRDRLPQRVPGWAGTGA